MTFYTPTQIQQLWISAGGNPQTAGQAAQAAFAKSAGNSDAVGGLWGLDRTKNVDSTNSARTAIAQTNNGLDFSALNLPNLHPADAVTSFFNGIFGIAGADIIFKYGLMVVFGSSLMIIGTLVMIAGSKPIKAGASLVAGSLLSGAGFGLGANATASSGTRRAVAGAISDEGEGGEAGEPAEPTKPIPPTGDVFARGPKLSGRKIRWDTAPTKEEPTVSAGGTSHTPRRLRPKVPAVPKRRTVKVVSRDATGSLWSTQPAGRHRRET